MFEPEPFGRYLLMERIAVGGMAEIFRAKSRSLAGFEKVLAIKRLHPRYGEDVDFIKMLIEEARISVGLAHVNIAQIFDLDKIEDHYFIAMELVEGRDLYRVLRRMSEREEQLPVEAAAWIASEVSNGLDYAHRKIADDGQPMNIVHRDISPQNLLLSWEGAVKIVDFGIAKASQRSFETESGVVKGKFYYMSPEQARGERVDHRSDLFSAGIVLYEMLTGSLLYREDDEVTLLSRVRKAEIEPPSHLRPDIPRDLERIVMRALQREPRRRYQSGRELGDDLRKFLFASGMRWNSSDAASLLGELFDQPYRPAPAPRGGEPTVEDGGLRQRTSGAPEADLDGVMVREEYEVDKSSVLYRLQPLDEEDSVPTRASALAARVPAPSDPFSTSQEVLTEELSLEDAEEVRSVPARPVLDEGLAAEVRAAGDFADATRRVAEITEEDLEQMGAVEDPDDLEDQRTDIFDPRGAPRPRDSDSSSDPSSDPPPPVRESKTPSQVDLPVAPRAETPISLPRTAASQPAPEAAPREAPAPDVRPLDDSLDISVPGERTSISRMDAVSGVQALGPRQRRAFLAFLVPVVVTGWGISWCDQVASRHTTVTVSPGIQAGEAVLPGLGGDVAMGRPGRLELRSNPPGAVVEVDGKVLVGRTPLTIEDLRADQEHSLALTLHAHEPWERRLSLTSGEARTLEADLERIEGVLEVITHPSGARVEINGRSRGQSPLETPGLFIGEEQEVVLRKGGYRPVTRQVEWNGRRIVTLEVHLKRDGAASSRAAATRRAAAGKASGGGSRPRKAAPKKARGGGDAHGYLSVSAIPWGKVYVDRRIYAPETPVLRGRVPAGRHSVKIYYPTLKRFSKAQTVKVRDGEEKKLFFRD